MTLQNIYDDIDFLCNSTSATYPTASKLRNINIHYQRVATLIWESAGSWQYDDSNATDFGIATTDLVDNQQDYSLPTNSQRLHKVEVMDSAGNYTLLTQKDLHDIDIATSEYYENGGTPLFYDLVGRSIFLYPIPEAGRVTLTNGLKIYFDRDVTNLTSTSDTPGFATAFHRLLSFGASLDFTRNDDEISKWTRQKQELEDGLQRFYSKRNVEGKTRIKPAGKKRWRQYQ